MASPLTIAASSAALAGLVTGMGFYAISSPASQLFGPTFVAPPQVQQVALTFDDGPNPAATPQLLEVLARHHVRATFFLIGAHVLREPGLTREIAAAGHLIGNHTMTHPWLPRLSSARIHDELRACNRALEDTLGRPVRFFRPPHGARRPAVLRIARALELETVQWNLIVGDWKPVACATLLARLERGMARNRGRGRGTNVVLHDGGQAGVGQPRLPTVAAVAELLPRLPRDTSFVTPQDWA